MLNPLKSLKCSLRLTRCRRRFSRSWPDRGGGTSGGGAVTATMNGKKQLLKIRIEPAAVIGLGGDKPDVEMLEDLVVAAVNEAGRKADEAIQSSVKGMLGGLKLPGWAEAFCRSDREVGNLQKGKRRSFDSPSPSTSSGSGRSG